jgi:hypothetical protein
MQSKDSRASSTQSNLVLSIQQHQGNTPALSHGSPLATTIRLLGMQRTGGTAWSLECVYSPPVKSDRKTKTGWARVRLKMGMDSGRPRPK